MGILPDVELEEFFYPDYGVNYRGATPRNWPAIRTFRYRSDGDFGALGKSFNDHLQEIIESGGPTGFMIRSWRHGMITNQIQPV